MNDKKPKLKRKKKWDKKEDAIHMKHHLGMSIAEIAMELGVSRRTVQRWLSSHDVEKRSMKRPEVLNGDERGRPRVYPAWIEEKVLELKRENMRRHATTIHRMLKEHIEASGMQCPSLSRVRKWLHENGLGGVEKVSRTGYVKFARDRPNDLWQVDIAGVQTVGHLGQLYLFALIDDCSRYIVAARYFREQKGINLLRTLRDALEEYGCPNQVLSDNGRQFRAVIDSAGTKYERLLKMTGVEPIFSKPYHPQSKGKLERFFGTVKTSFLSEARFQVEKDPSISLPGFNEMLGKWINWYNNEKPHRSLPGRGSPAGVYFSSEKRVHKPLKVEMNWHRWFLVEGTRKVSKYNTISYKRETIQLPPGHAGCKVEVLESDCRFEVYHDDDCLAIHEVDLELIDIKAKKFKRKVARNGNIKYKRNEYYVGPILSGRDVFVREIDQGLKIAVYHEGKLVEEFDKKEKNTG